METLSLILICFTIFLTLIMIKDKLYGQLMSHSLQDTSISPLS